MATDYNPSIVTDGLVLCVDAANTKSYPGSGTTWTDISSKGNNGTLTNGPTFSSGNGGAIVFDGTNDYVDFGSQVANLSTSTISFWIKLQNNDSRNYVIQSYTANSNNGAMDI